MGLPNVNIVFKQRAAAAVQQGAVGILALVLKDASVTSVTEYHVRGVEDIPANVKADNKQYITMALLGAPKEIKVVVIPESASDYAAALDYLETIKFNVVAFPGAETAAVTVLTLWAKGMFSSKDRKIMAVLPNAAADHPAVINFATDQIEVSAAKYTTTQFTARIAGLIAGLPLTVAPTFQVLTEVTNVPKLTKAEADAAINAGKLILYHDGEKVKIARGVTSLVTATEETGEDWKKIKVARILNKTYHDIKETIEDLYIGKVQNSYINKLLLVSAISNYYEQLEQDGILDPGKNRVEIDIPTQRLYLKTILGADEVARMDEQQIKEANTKDQVFLTAVERPLDAMEDIKLTINL
ncbi:phage tail sheath subtilisin-like domain-containing protein [Paenibacillus sp. N1-5-1-14]|uniref:phage tail sheath subtilisin-like domain-containing protein n=1 Tax=Paenibacillus radicibacter TaxID=2972488 RepID=UPI0021596E65|nr:phage tail sheath subtilisin-like domain-containing protein [Paenibacillus radicibacter]MCR8645582.1 phage tail sheath subtilisin-like domain-containing protein [Paenibacillus radicibacter]